MSSECAYNYGEVHLGMRVEPVSGESRSLTIKLHRLSLSPRVRQKHWRIRGPGVGSNSRVTREGGSQDQETVREWRADGGEIWALVINEARWPVAVATSALTLRINQEHGKRREFLAHSSCET